MKEEVYVAVNIVTISGLANIRSLLVMIQHKTYRLADIRSLLLWLSTTHTILADIRSLLVMIQYNTQRLADIRSLLVMITSQVLGISVSPNSNTMPRKKGLPIKKALIL